MTDWRTRLVVWWRRLHPDDRLYGIMVTLLLIAVFAMCLTFGVFQVGVGPRGEDGKLLTPTEVLHRRIRELERENMELCACP